MAKTETETSTGFRNRPHAPAARKGSLKKEKPAAPEAPPCSAYEFNVNVKVILKSRVHADGFGMIAGLVNPNSIRQKLRQMFEKGFNDEVAILPHVDVLSDANIHKVEIKNGEMFPLVPARNTYKRK